MADEVIIKYRADVSELLADLNKVADAQSKLGNTAKTTGDALKNSSRQTSEGAKKATGAIEILEGRLKKLREAQRTTNDPTRVKRYEATIRSLSRRMDELKGKTDKAFNSSKVRGFGNELKKVDKQTKRADRTSGKLTQTFRRVGVAFAAAFSIKQLIAFTEASINATREFEALGKAISFIEGGAEQGASAFAFIRSLSEELGLELRSTIEAFKQFSGASRLAGSSASETREIFESVATAVTAMQLSAAQADRVFLALSQIISKGVVSAEELRRQLGDALPGAFSIAARSAGKTEAEFNKLLETGQIISKDFLPAFAEELRTTFEGGAVEGAKSLNAEFNRLQNEVTELQLQIGEETAPLWLKFKKFGLDALGSVIDMVRDLGVITGFILTKDLTGLTVFLDRTDEIAEATKTVLADIEAQEKIIQKRRLDDIDAQIDALNELQDKKKELTKEDIEAIEALEAERVKIQQKSDELRLKAVEEVSAKIGGRINAILERELSNTSFFDDESGERIRTFGQAVGLLDRTQEKIDKLQDEIPSGVLPEEFFDTSGLNNYNRELDSLRDSWRTYFSLLGQGGSGQLQLLRDLQRQIKVLDGETEELNEAINPIDDGITKPTKEAIAEVKRLQKEFRKLGEMRLPLRGLPDVDEAKRLADAIVNLTEESGQSIETSFKVILTKNRVAFDSFLAGMVQELLDFNDAIKDSQQRNTGDVEKITTSSVAAVVDSFKREIDLLQEFADAAIQIFINSTDERIRQIDRQERALLDSISREREALTEDRQNRLITERAYQEGLSALEEKERKAKEESEKAKGKIKAKAAKLEKAAALLTIAVNTAQAVAAIQAQAAILFSNPLTAIFAPAALAQIPFVLGSAAAQAAVIAAQPIPRFEKGTKGKEGSGMAVVGEKGEETVWLPNGAKVLPNDKHKKHGEVLDAMYDNRFDDYVYSKYITPALLEQKRRHEDDRQSTFAENVASSVVLNAGLTYGEASRIQRKGTNINNAEELADAIAERLYTNDRRL